MTSRPEDQLLSAVSGLFSARMIPALTDQLVRWRKTKPLDGVRVLDATPLFFNTCLKYAALLAAGADLTVAYSDRLPYSEQALALLKKSGIPTLFNAFENAPKEIFDVVVDCGALHKEMNSKYGAAELTRTGVDPYIATGKNVFLTDSGRVKMIETCLGTGESCLRALKHCGYPAFDGKKVLLFGGGKVGRGIRMYFRRAGAVVDLVDGSVPGAVDHRDTATVVALAAEADFIVSATGIRHAHHVYAPELARTDAVIVNMGVEDEYGPAMPENRVLNRKKTLNFLLDEPTKTCYIDPTLALHNEAVSVLLKTPAGTGAILPGEALENTILDLVRNAGLIGDEVDEMLQTICS